MTVAAFFAAIFAPFFYGLLNFIDERFVSSLIKRVPTLIFYTTMTGLALSPILFIFYPFQIPTMGIFLLSAASGVFFVLAFMPYFYAFRYADTSVIAALGGLSYIFVPIVAFFALGETVPVQQYAGFAVLLIAAAFLTINRGAKFSINAAFWLCMLSGFFWAWKEVAAKASLAHINMGMVYFITMVSAAAFVAIINMFGKNPREVAHAWAAYRSKLWLFLLAEFLQMAAIALSLFAIIYLPLTVVTGFGQLQPVFALLISWAVLAITGRTYNEALDRRSVYKKIVLFALMIVGAVLLAV